MFILIYFLYIYTLCIPLKGPLCAYIYIYRYRYRYRYRYIYPIQSLKGCFVFCLVGYKRIIFKNLFVRRVFRAVLGLLTKGEDAFCRPSASDATGSCACAMPCRTVDEIQPPASCFLPTRKRSEEHWARAPCCSSVFGTSPKSFVKSSQIPRMTPSCTKSFARVAAGLSSSTRGPDAMELAPGCQPPAYAMTLILIDARWDQARIMLNRSSWLQNLPRITLPKLVSRYRFRRQPEPGCLSTLEAAAEALGVLEPKRGLREALLKPFDEMIRLQSQFLPNKEDKNLSLLSLEPGEEAPKENAHPRWNRRRKRRHRRRLLSSRREGSDGGPGPVGQEKSARRPFLGFRVLSLVWGLGFRVWGLGFRV